MYHRLETVTQTAQEEDLVEIQRHARAQGVSTEAILRHVRRMTHMQYDERVSTAVGLHGFAGVSLGRVELPQSDTGTLRADGWRAHTVGENSVVPVRRDAAPHVWNGGEGEERGGPLREIKGRW